ncbi:MAG TPA: hypothetical protein VFI78_04360, partial [Salinimicrobium sp.]|nr:hypothetical protein [Salinimicrobium sp.]
MKPDYCCNFIVSEVAMSMDNFKVLHHKLEAFIRRFYINELIKGAFLFLAIGLLYFIITLIIEYFLWLEPFWRQILFWIFVGVEGLLLLKFIVSPLLRLFKISKGINYEEASRIIGDHFPEVKDKLLNVLQLNKSEQQSELLLAGIDQKARELKPVPFKLAINFKKNLSYLKYAAIPVGILFLLYLSGNSHLFAESYNRMVHYKMAYQPPAPFSFKLLNDELKVREGESVKLQIRTLGNIVPENASIHYNDQTYFLQKKSPGIFEYTFESVGGDLNFHFSGNEVVSKTYKLDMVRVPKMLDFEMLLDFPNYTGIENKIQKGHGNATIPEGTRVEWKLKTEATNKVNIQFEDTLLNFDREKDDFLFGKRFYNSSDYKITTSNPQIKNYEALTYSLDVVKDQYPEINLKRQKDSVELQTWYFQGEVSDDYGISKVRLVIYPSKNPKEKNFTDIPVSYGNFDQFFMVFPGELELQKGVQYDYYFEVFDNDALRSHKSTKSRIFSFRSKTEEALKEEQLVRQNEAIEGLSKSLEQLESSEVEMQEIERIQRLNGELEYQDRKKLENFLERQQRQNELMKRYSEKLKKSLENIVPEEGDKAGKQLRERLERREERLEKNEKLLEELEKYAGKISEEQLAKELEKLSKNTQNQQKNLKQLLELTKR